MVSTTGGAGTVVVCVETVVSEDRLWLCANAVPVIIATTATLASQYFVIAQSPGWDRQNIDLSLVGDSLGNYLQSIRFYSRHSGKSQKYFTICPKPGSSFWGFLGSRLGATAAPDRHRAPARPGFCPCFGNSVYAIDLIKKMIFSYLGLRGGATANYQVDLFLFSGIVLRSCVWTTSGRIGPDHGQLNAGDDYPEYIV
jgi:hypothetical protein